MIRVKALETASNSLSSLISSEIEESSRDSKRVLFIVPETSKATIERMIMDEIITSSHSSESSSQTDVIAGLVNYDIISFIKLSERIVSSCGVSLDKRSDDILLRNVIYRTFVLHGNEFKTISKYVKRFEYIDLLIHLLGDFTRYGVTIDSLDEVLGSSTTEDDFYNKIYDVKLLMSFIQEANDEFGFSLMENYLSQASSLVKKVLEDGTLLDRRLYSGLRSLVDSRIVIYGFGTVRTFTPQEYELITSLSTLGSDIVIYPLYSDSRDNEDLYYFGKRLVDKLSKDRMISSIEKFVGKTRDVSNNLQTISLAYSYDEQVNIERTDNSVELIKMTNPDDMLSFVCNEIVKLTREGTHPYRYRDIRVFCPDESIVERFKGIMHLFKMDAFIDRKIVLNSTPVMRYVELLLELDLHNYPIEDVLRLLRTGVVNITGEEIDYFENYARAKNITFSNNLFDISRYTVSSDNVEEIDTMDLFKIYIGGSVIADGGTYLYEHVVQKCLIPIREVIGSIKEANTIHDKSIVLLSHLGSLKKSVEMLRNRYISYKDTDTASSIVRGYKEIMGLLSSFATEVNDIEIDLERYASLIKLDIRNKVIGTIPLTVDSIEIVSEEAACYTPCKVLFMIGCNANNFPYKSLSDGILTNNELLRLSSEMSVDLPDKALTQTKESFIRASLIMNLVSDKAYMFVLSDEFESPLMTYYREALNVDEVPIRLFRTPIYGMPVDRRFDYLNAMLSPDIVSEILGDKAGVSVSSIEKYNRCAFNYMLDNLLKIRAREDETSIKLNIVGTLVHEMFECSIKDIVKDNTSIDKLKQYLDSLDDSTLNSMADKYFGIARLHISSPDRNLPIYEINPGMKVKRIFKRALPLLLGYCVECKYLPTFFEYRLEDMENKLKVVTDNGIEFLFRGSIDRVDVNSANNLRVVDYKTGSKSIDIKKFIAGVQIQLFSYALALREQDDNSTIDNVGYIEAVLSPSSEGKKTPFSYESSKFDSDNINHALDYAMYVINKSCNDISSGRADARVNSKEKESCEYCPFKGVCGNNPREQQMRVINTSLPDDMVDPDRHKDGQSFSMEYYIDVMRRNEDNA